MTRKEAIRRVESCRNFLVDNYSDMGEPNFMAFNMAINALEQENVLDKIRAEIEQLRNFSAENYDLEQYCDYFDARIIFRDDVLQIIDKYRKGD